MEANSIVHKQHDAGTTPTVRPISSESGIIYENIGQYFEHPIKYITKECPAYLQDTIDFSEILRP